MSNVNRFRAMQNLAVGDYKEPSFIPTNRDVSLERTKRFVAQKLLSGWDAKDVIEYLVNFNYFSEMKARAIVVPIYNRITTPLKELRREYH